LKTPTQKTNQYSNPTFKCLKINDKKISEEAELVQTSEQQNKRSQA